VRPGAQAATLTRTTGRPRWRNASASPAERATISCRGCAVGKPVVPFCKSMVTSAATGSSLVRGIMNVSFNYGTVTGASLAGNNPISR
jgi:hypothetical protein